MQIVAFILFLMVASVCAYIAEMIVPGKAPGGFLASAVVGIIGAWIGGNLVGHFGPDLAGVSLLPTIIGSAVLVFGMALISGGFRKGKSV
jgi:uncharacterized membrane protein YeaQ/YmgE (transglycosylase-associated protein family)